MPVITYASGKMDEKTKLEMINKLSATASAISGIPIQSFTVILQEYEDTNIGIGGEYIGKIKARHIADAIK
ncbi:tautomerase family protein [Maridesulfovibrio zosterae]|uniref:tautomerase family protein n=1 Tax=Maridesulfovibrio zosterae TaxID=82171 RepID=UPI000415A5BE|nr:tautomerase family protein [Maridesulfovibrio zosterae]